jgi:uncharacterized protein (TIGR03083 family)
MLRVPGLSQPTRLLQRDDQRDEELHICWTLSVVSLWDAPVRDVRSVAADERRRLLAFLEGLTPGQWVAPSAAPGWTVQDLALHLLDDDMSWLSHRRDGSTAGRLDMSDRERFVELLAAKNQRWVEAVRGLSRRIVVDLLAWTGDQVDAFQAGCDLRGDGWVSWASSEAVPFWFNMAQEFTERWVHQQQMREAVGQVDDHADHLPEVLRTFMWALPHQLGPPADAATVLEVTVVGVARWTLTPNGVDEWAMAERAAKDPTVTVVLSPDAAWRSFTGATVPPDQVVVTGPRDLTDAVMRVRAIIV